MDFIGSLLTAQAWPQGGVWESIIKWFSDGVGGKIAIAIILLTICLKVLMLPLDFWQKYNTRKMTVAQDLMKDELDAIKAKYQDPNVVNQKTMEVYKKHNFKPTSGCLPMLVYMVVTMVVFFTLFSALGNISRTKVNYEYAQLQETYVASYDQAIADGQTPEEALVTAQGEVVVKYDQIREGFLSVKTIWRPDNWSSVFPNYTEFVNGTATRFGLVEIKDGETVVAKYMAKQANGDYTTDPYKTLDGKIYVSLVDTTLTQVTINEKVYQNTDWAEVTPQGEETMDQATKSAAIDNFKTTFETVTNGINNQYQGVWNGYLGLIVLTAVITFLSQFLSSIGTKTRDKKGNQVSGAKLNPVMGIVMAAIMVFFVVNYTSMFALYIVVSNILSVAFSIGMNLIINKIEDGKDKKKQDKITPDYVRK